MPEAKVVFYKDDDGSCPVVEWLGEVVRRDEDAFGALIECIDRLRELGNEIRRPHADLLRDGIWELRTRQHGVHYRLLFGWAGSQYAVVAHGCTKIQRVAERDVRLAIDRLKKFKAAPDQHIYEVEEQ